MNHLNCIVVFNQHKEKVLFCKRMKDPYKGLYNFVGGKVEPGESHISAAYRELQEETGIGRGDIHLFKLMDFTYYYQEFVLEIYVGQLKEDVKLTPELNPLEWLTLSENFADSGKFAGDQNIAHIINVALKFPLGKENKLYKISTDFCSLGIDGCKGGWIAAEIKEGKLNLYKFGTISELVNLLTFDSCLIDMVIGLCGSAGHIRPDGYARRILKKRSPTVFSAPCRKAVYEDTKEKRIQANLEVLNKKLISQTDAIIPKIRELDEFLQANVQYKNRICESHPEVCFARLKGEVLMTSKHDAEGIKERAAVIADYYPEVTENWAADMAKKMGCKEDDILDSICLAIVSNLYAQGNAETIPDKPMQDDTGLFMQMVIPRM